MIRRIKKFYNINIAPIFGLPFIYNSSAPIKVAYYNTRDNLISLRKRYNSLNEDYQRFKKGYKTLDKKQQSLIRALGKDYIKKIIKLEEERSK